MIKIIKKNLALVILILSAVLVSISPVFALTRQQAELQRQKDYYAAQAEQARKQAAEKAQQATYVKQQINNLDNQIDGVQAAMAKTDKQISSTQDKIESLKDQIKEQEKILAEEKEKMGTVIASWYMEGEDGLFEAMLASNNLSELVTKQQYYDSIRQQIDSTIQKIDALKAELKKQNDEQSNQLNVLMGLKDDQSAQEKNLETSKTYKDRLLNDTNNAVADLKEQEQAAQAKLQEVQRQINALTATKSWGTDIVSSGGGLSVPYYTQTGNQTRLGNSPYTVNLYGCLVTSLSMVATYYGHSITPTEFANTGSFSSGGYLIGYPPSLGVNVGSSQPIDWGRVNEELDNNHPVVVSIYLPSVGALNSDGSSHFIVIKGRSGSKYLMNDPISESGRSYALGQVRSMKIIRSY